MFSGMGRSVWKEACATLQNILSAAEPVLPDNKALRNKCIVPMSDIEMVHPIIVGSYTDFFCSVRDGRNCGVYLLLVADSSQSKLVIHFLRQWASLKFEESINQMRLH